MKVQLDIGAYVPVRAHETDAGLDIRSRDNKIVLANGSAIFRTGVHVEIPAGYAGLLVSKSGLNVMNDITSTGLIDEGYTGEIVIKLMNHGDEDYIVRKGDKISQLVLIPVRYDYVEIVDRISKDTDRQDNGFGSTGR